MLFRSWKVPWGQRQLSSCRTTEVMLISYWCPICVLHTISKFPPLQLEWVRLIIFLVIATTYCFRTSDFHGMWGMGSMLRDTGAFFMRRSYTKDDLYWDTFRQYIHQLVTKGDLPIEFFIEGTRSRSLKSLTPKLGKLLTELREGVFLIYGGPINWKLLPSCPLNF